MSLFNPKTRAEKDREAVIQERNRAILENLLAPVLTREFKRLGRDAAKQFEAGGFPAVDRAIQAHRQNIEKMLQKTYSLSIDGTSKRVIKESDDLVKSGQLDMEMKDVQGTITSLFQTWITTNALRESQDISQTSRGLIVNSINKFDAAGEEVLSKVIFDAVGGAISRSRARVIARTETHAAAQDATLSVVRGLGLPETLKEWVPVTDGRTRDDHRPMLKQDPIPLDDNFNVGGRPMKRPGDRSGGAKNVINCRCVLVFQTQG